MSRSTKLKLEKTKVQVVFRLQFHATRIPQPGWDKLLVSFVPADSGKAAAKTAKANVRNGNCKWSDPIYETTRLLQDAETNKYDEKLYKIVVSMGSSRMSLGEAKINLADYAESLKPSTVVLPLQGCKFGTILHVTIQLLTSKFGFREFEQQRELREKRFHKATKQSVGDNPDGDAESQEESANLQIDEVNARAQWKSDSPKPPSLEEKGELNEDFVDSAVGNDSPPNTLKSFSAEKNDGSRTCAEVPQGGKICNLLVGTLVDSKTGIGNVRKNADDSSVHDLLLWFQKALLLMEETLREIQNKAHIKYPEKNLAFLKPDLETLEYVLHSLKERTSHAIPFQNMPQKERISQSVKEVKVLGELAVQGDAMEKQHEMFSSSGTEHQMSQDLDCRRNNLEAAAKTSKQISELLSQLEKSKAECETETAQIEFCYKPMIQDLKESEKKLLDELLHLRDEHSSCIYTIDDLKSQMERMRQDMNEQLRSYTEDRCRLDDVNKELEKRVLASETTFNRVHQHYSIAVHQLQKDLELLSFQVISLFETNNNVSWQPFVEASETYSEFIEECPHNAQSCLKKDGSESAIQKEQDEMNLHAIQEDIAILGETVEQGEELQYDGNHTVERMFSSLEEVSTQEETICEYKKCTCVQEQLDFLCESTNTKLLKEDAHCGVRESPIHLQQVLCDMTEQEISENFVLKLNSEVFSSILQETLCELNVGIRFLRQKMNELAQQLQDCAEVKESLMLQLQTALGDIEALKASEGRYITKCNKLSFENLSLETKLRSISDENYLFTQKAIECQKLVDESRTYISKYETCSVEKNELEEILKQEREEKVCLKIEIASLSKELKALKEEFDKQSSAKDGLEKTVTFLQERLEGMISRIVSHNEKTDSQILASKSLQLASEDKNFPTMFWHLEELQQSAYTQVLQLKEENMEMKQKIEFDVREMEAKLDQATVQVEKLQLELQDVEGKLMTISKVAEKHAEENEDLSLKLSLLEVELQHVAIANEQLNQKIQALDGIDKELESTKSSAMDIKKESEPSVMSPHAAIKEPLQLEKENRGQRECLSRTHDKIKFDGCLRDELEALFRDQTTKVLEKEEQMLSFDDKKADFVHIREQLSDPHLKDSRVRNVLSHDNGCQRKADEDASFLCCRVTDLDADLDVMHEYLLAAEIEVIFAENQFWSRIQELLERLNSLEKCNEDILLKHLDIMNKLNGPLGKIEQFEENADLVKSVHLMKFDPEINIKKKREQVKFEDERSSQGGELEKHDKSIIVVMESETSQEMHGHEVEIEQLERILNKEQLKSICPLFEEVSGSGRALERALEPEIEHPQALQAKKQSSTYLHSSFPEQHNDDESAIFKNYKDMNDQIKDMLEIKRRHALVEAELKDMQERYFQLSLRFAEMEGERQQLIMELKNVKLPKKP